MKIALVSRITGWHKPGGLGHVAQTRAEALASAGHDVHVLTTTLKPEPLADPFNPDCGVTLHELRGPRAEWSEPFSEDCAKLCADLSPDVIHFESLDRWRPWWKDRPGSPKCIATTMHGEDIGCSFTEWRSYRDGKRMHFDWDSERVLKLTQILKTFDCLLATARFDEWIFRDLYGHHRVHLIYNPVPECFFEGVTEPSPYGFFLFSCLWGGDERGSGMARMAASAAGVELKQFPKCKRRELPEKYDSSHALLLPSYQSQGFDLSVAESLVRRRPVVASDVGLWWFEDMPGLIKVPLTSRPAWVDAIKTIEASGDALVPTSTAMMFHPSRHVHDFEAAVESCA